MVIEFVLGAALLVGSAGALLVFHRDRHYRLLAASLGETLSTGGAQIQLPAHPLPEAAQSVTRIPELLPQDMLTAIRSEIDALAAVERSYIPTHKKGGTIAYESVIAGAPTVTRLYHSEALRRLVSRIVGIEVQPTPLHDQSSLSILIYDRPGDHIDWHFDHNFYRGRHFTVLLPVVNTGTAADGLSHARLSARIDGAAQVIPTPPNSLVVFEGARLEHKASPIAAGERRILVSMTFCVDPRATLAQAVTRRLKDTAFFGLRALWT